MMRLWTSLLAASLPALSTNAASAHPAVRFEASDEHTVEISAASGFEDALAPLSLEGTLALPALGRTMLLGAGVTVPLLRPDLRDHRIDLGAALPLLGSTWDVRVSGGLREVSTRNEAMSATSLGAVLGARPGYYAPRWTLAAETELWTALITSMRATPYAVEVGGAQPWHGVRALTAASVKAGLAAGALCGRLDLQLRGGYESRGRMNLVIPPLYLGAGVGYRF